MSLNRHHQQSRPMASFGNSRSSIIDCEKSIERLRRRVSPSQGATNTPTNRHRYLSRRIRRLKALERVLLHRHSRSRARTGGKDGQCIMWNTLSRWAWRFHWPWDRAVEQSRWVRGSSRWRGSVASGRPGGRRHRQFLGRRRASSRANGIGRAFSCKRTGWGDAAMRREQAV